MVPNPQPDCRWGNRREWQGCAAYVAGARVGRDGQKHASSRPCSCRKAVRGLTQPTLHPLFFPFKWERFPRRPVRLDLRAERSPVPGGFFPEAASWTGRVTRVCLSPKFVSWTKVNKSFCSDSFHKAQRALHKSGQSQPAQMRASGGPPRLTHCTPCSKHVLCQRGNGSSSSPVTMHKRVPRETLYCLPLLWFPLTSCSKHNRQSTNSLPLMGVKEKSSNTPA